jgi:hypothetical protein
MMDDWIDICPVLDLEFDDDVSGVEERSETETPVRPIKTRQSLLVS